MCPGLEGLCRRKMIPRLKQIRVLSQIKFKLTIVILIIIATTEEITTSIMSRITELRVRRIIQVRIWNKSLLLWQRLKDTDGHLKRQVISSMLRSKIIRKTVSHQNSAKVIRNKIMNTMNTMNTMNRTNTNTDISKPAKAGMSNERSSDNSLPWTQW